MNPTYLTEGEINLEEDLTEDYGDSQFTKKRWFGPGDASIARLERVKPLATVYNLGLRDARDLKVGRHTTTAEQLTNRNVSRHNATVDELSTEPPLSTVSYQKAAWGSSGSIPDLVREAVGPGTKPTRPSRPASAKATTVTRPPAGRRSRPQSAKDPLCLDGKKKVVPLGVRGQKFDPTDRFRTGLSPVMTPAATPLGWAGPPAGLHDPSEHTANGVQPPDAAIPRSQQPPPPAPVSSPEPQEATLTPDLAEGFSPPPSPALCLSLSLPSADADATDANDEPDTSRLLAQADQFVKVERVKETQRVKYFTAHPHAPGRTPKDKATDAVGASKGEHSQREEAINGRPASDGGDGVGREGEGGRSGEAAAVTTTDARREGGGWRDGEVGTSSDPVTEDLAAKGDIGDTGEGEDPPTTPTADTDAPLPPSNGYSLQYLGPARGERKARSHPIFLTPGKQAGKLSHSSLLLDDSQPAVSRQDKQGSKPLPQNAQSEGMASPPTEPEKNVPKTAAPRSAVLIREDRNVTVDITPRNLGRKVTGKSRRNRAGQGVADLEVRGEGGSGVKDIWAEVKDDISDVTVGDSVAKDSKGGVKVSGSGVKVNCTGDSLHLEVTSAASKARSQSPSGARPATPVSVVYDDDGDNDDGDCLAGRKQRRRRRGPVKEKDLVTMVSNLSESEEEGEVERGKSPVTFSTGERNYYEVSQKQTKGDKPWPGQEEKENLITVTTKTLLFDLEKGPQESVVRSILEAPLGKVVARETQSPTPGVKVKVRGGAADKVISRPPRPGRLTTSDLRCVTPVPPASPPRPGSGGRSDGGFSAPSGLPPPPDEERPGSRMGFVSMETEEKTGAWKARSVGLSDENKEQMGQGARRRPPSGKRRPLSAASPTLNQPRADPSVTQSQKAKDSGKSKRRPLSASPAVDRSPSVADVQRANAAAQALRTERENSAKASSSNHRTGENKHHYAAYSRCGTSQHSNRARSASTTRKPVQMFSKKADVEEEDSEVMEECKRMQTRMAGYGVDIPAATLERALYPPSGKTLYYQMEDALPKSYSSGLLSHPRFWLPVEHKRLRLAEKKLAQAELSLWKQRKAEERRAKSAADREAGKKAGKKKGKKKLTRSQSVC